MAYPTVSAPYGFQPINRVDGMPYAGATRQYQIDDAAWDCSRTGRQSLYRRDDPHHSFRFERDQSPSLH